MRLLIDIIGLMLSSCVCSANFCYCTIVAVTSESSVGGTLVREREYVCMLAPIKCFKGTVLKVNIYVLYYHEHLV